jgi:hypothetical protein
MGRHRRGELRSKEREPRNHPWYLAGNMVLILGLIAYFAAGAVVPGHHRSTTGRYLLLGNSSRLYASEMAALQNLKLINYYPARVSWAYMWNDFQAGTINQDMARMAGLHANGVRVIISVPAFGFPQPHSWALSDLHQVVEMAQNHGLRVQLTLFDWFGNWSNIQGSQEWAQAVLAPYEGNPEIAFIELHNEINPADPAQMAWCRAMLQYVEAQARGVPVTVSVTNGVPTLIDLRADLGEVQPNFWDLHYYGPAGAAYATFAAARAAVSPTPLYIGEFGFSTWLGNVSNAPGLPAFQGDLEAYQASYYAAIEAATYALGLPAAAPWTLYDFSLNGTPPSSPAQYQFGIYRLNGSAKPAAAVLQGFFSTGQVNTSFNQNFAQQVGTAGDPLPALWQLHQSSAGTFEWDSTVAYAGSPSARLSGAGPTCPAYSVTPPNGFVVPGQSVSASVHARGSVATGASGLSLIWMNAEGEQIIQAGQQYPAVALGDGTTPWTSLQTSATAPAGAAYVQINLASCANQGTVWFAGVKFVPAPVAASSKRERNNGNASF